MLVCLACGRRILPDRRRRSQDSEPFGSPVVLALLPALCEEVEVYILFRVSCDDLFVQLDAQPWSLWQSKVAVYNLGHTRLRLADPGVSEVVEVLLKPEVSGAGHEMQGSGRANLTTDVVRGDCHVVGVGPGGKFLGLQKSPDLTDVWLYHVRCLEFEELTVLVALMDPLAGRHRR